MRVLVTGATGNVGRHLVDALLAGGHRVRALTRSPERADLPPGVEVVAGDLTDPTTLDDALGEIDGIDGIDAVHLFAVGAGDVAGTDVETYAAEVVARLAAGGVRRFTVLDGVGTVPLGAAAVAAGGTTIAPVEFMANALSWADGIRDEGLVREASADSPSTVVHEADIAAVSVAVLTGDGEHAGATLMITGPEALTVHERVAILAEVGGRAVRVEEPTREETLAQWRSWGLGEDVIAQFLAWSDAPPDVSATPLDTVERITGRPGRTFRAWACEHVDAFR